jgi:hypothetical protein
MLYCVKLKMYIKKASVYLKQKYALAFRLNCQVKLFAFNRYIGRFTVFLFAGIVQHICIKFIGA